VTSEITLTYYKNIAHALLVKHIPDSTLIVISSCATVKLMWYTIMHNYIVMTWQNG